MSVTIKIRVNKTSNGSPVIYDVSNDLIINSLLPEERADFSLEVGTFKIISSVIDYNIPPYSICEIFDGVRYFYYCVSSECNSYLTTGKWVHDCKLLALESLLECYVLGAKTYSLNNVGSDYQVCQFTTNLLKLQDNGFVFDNSNSYSLLVNAHNEYTFPDGTTFYEAFKQIANKNKIRLNLSIYNNSFTSNDLYFKIALMGENMASYNIVDTDGALNFKLLQNVDDYCKYLLTCGSDVVDRDNKTTFKGLTCRASNGVAIDADHAEIILPTRVEGITRFIINGYVGIGNMQLKTPYFNEAYVDYWYDDYDSISKWTVARTLHEWRTNGNGLSYWQYLYDYWLKDLGLDNAYFKVIYYSSGSSSIWAGQTFAVLCDDEGNEYYSVEDSQKYHYYTNRDMTKYLVTTNEFEAIDVEKQPNYVVYESGSNKIFNLHAQYKNDFWSNILSITEYGMFDNRTNYKFTDTLNDYSIDYIYTIGPGDSASSPMNYTFDIECVPITNPILIDEKNDTPENEDSYKPMTRTYSMGDNNGLIVDFKALTNDIDKQNETLGKVEAVLEVDSSKLYTYELDDNDNEVEVEYTPRPNDEIHFDFKGTNYTFYISSIVKRFTATKMIYQLNLTKTRFKIADAIGVDYQFNPTYLPLENIVERALFFEKTKDNFVNIVNSGTLLVELNFTNGTTSYQTLYVMPVVMKANGYWVLYCEAMDNIVFGMSTNVVDSSKKSIDNVTYGDDEANSAYVSVSIRHSTGSLSLSESYLLPKYPTGKTLEGTIIVQENKLIYKDSREKLTFTIKVNDSTI